jgi:hypothetical protein
MVKAKEIIRHLESAERAATFKTAHFAFDNDARNEEIKEATRIYRESWILPDLDHAIRLLAPAAREGQCSYCGVAH